MKLTRYEKQIEQDLLNGVYREGSKEDTERIKAAIEAYRKNAILHIRINQGVLEKLKEKAAKVGVKYQTFIAEALRHIAHS